jgi:uncharacterized protein (TIGR03437 family)
VNGAASWTAIDLPAGSVSQFLVDAQNPNNLYEVTTCTSGNTGCVPGYSDLPNVRKSSDGGLTWNYLTYGFGSTVTNMALDPRVSGRIVAATSGLPGCFMFGCNGEPAIFSSTDGGITWTQAPNIYPNTLPLLVDPSTNPSTIYDGLVESSTDGIHWTPLSPLPGATTAGAAAYALDASGNIYAYAVTGTYTKAGMFVSHDHGATWTAIGSPTTGAQLVSIVPAGTSSLNATLFSATDQSEWGTAGFLSKISADGSTLEYSTYLRGHESTENYSTVYREPIFFDTQNWISGIALDSLGNVVVTGGTRAVDFPTDNPQQAANAGLADGFVASVSADGSHLNYSTYLGGSQDDGGLAIGLDPKGNVIVAGQTFSLDFPVPSGAVEPAGGGDAFVVKLALPVIPAIASVVNGASYQPGIEAGSWVTIKGSNLANSTRTWQTSDFVGATAPTALDGVSVTVDGVPASVEYISPTQINVLAPPDSTLGNVNVVVDNNGALSAPATAQLQALAPAFFLSSRNYVTASRLPDYAAVGTPTAPAHPGDLIVLWGTGFGNPVVAPTVTIGGVSVPVVSAVMTAGSPGLDQLTIQIPANAPTGTLTVQASFAGAAPTQSGLSIVVANP